MITPQNKIFKHDRVRYYTNIDIGILDKYRTIPNVYLFHSKFNPSDLLDIDVNRAYIGAVIQIDMIPIFNEFECLVRYNDH